MVLKVSFDDSLGPSLAYMQHLRTSSAAAVSGLSCAPERPPIAHTGAVFGLVLGKDSSCVRRLQGRCIVILDVNPSTIQ